MSFVLVSVAFEPAVAYPASVGNSVIMVLLMVSLVLVLCKPPPLQKKLVPQESKTIKSIWLNQNNFYGEVVAGESGGI